MNINRLIVFVSLSPSTHLIERQHKHDWYGCTIPSPLHAHTRYCLPSPQLQNKISTKTRMSPVHWDFNMLLWCVWVLDSICKIKNSGGEAMPREMNGLWLVFIALHAAHSKLNVFTPNRASLLCLTVISLPLICTAMEQPWLYCMFVVIVYASRVLTWAYRLLYV